VPGRTGESPRFSNLPDDTDSLLAALDALVPERSPRRGDAHDEILRQAGARDLVRDLITARKAQLDRRARDNKGA
jgi:hypothetical protein